MAKQTAKFQVLESNRQFTTTLYNVLAERPGNVVFSPISVHAVLSMSYQGAKGITAEKFASILQVPTAAAAAEGYNIVMNRLNSIPNVTILMANKIYLMEGYQLLPEFSNVITKNFLSEVQLLNFAANQVAATKINAWVEEKTKEQIKNLISKEALNASTRLVLVNAIYFKGSWKDTFDEEDTTTEPFYLNHVDSVEVQMMHSDMDFYYKSDPKLCAKILKLPYTDENLSMVIILPYDRNGIAELEKNLATVNITEIIQDMCFRLVTVALPKFKVEKNMDLKSPLTKLGFAEIFDKSVANFGGMITADEQLFVSKFIQKVFIEVNERGSEAAAATTGTLEMFCRKPDEFIADHPFIYFLYDKKSTCIFAGRLFNPNDTS
ncbi:hypothetical protein Zmor_014015 [Zophobas morio]|uniref:Serpin domain-containing protein n=1 Tax=Zophobas morio TaxID=2755281 RepID=A0AA38IE11_9CUCU|nr:hypothetical protein Zmor_014015 [Zophobas morio]